MVKLNRIYTRTGDAGSTGLGDGRRVAKDDPRVEAYGDVDDANGALGVAVSLCTPRRGPLKKLAVLLERIQNELFDVGADLCCPITPGERPGERLRITAEQAASLEPAIDHYNEPLAPLNSFVLPGGTPLACALHVARTVTRRAERRVATLKRLQPRETNEQAIVYLNRLSDLLFVLARAANRRGRGSLAPAGKGDVLWVPGKGR